MISVPKITLSTDKDNFFSKLKPGDIFRYSLSYTYYDIRDIAEGYQMIIERCEPGSLDYSKYGRTAARVIKTRSCKEGEGEEIIFHFDPQQLVI